MCFYFLQICRILRKFYIPVIYYFCSNLFYILQLCKDRGLRPIEVDFGRRFSNPWDSLRLHYGELNVLVDLQVIEIIVKKHGDGRSLDQDAESKNHIYRENDDGGFLSPRNGIQQFRYRYYDKWCDRKQIAWPPSPISMPVYIS